MELRERKISELVDEITGTIQGKVTVELTPREFELLARAYTWWSEMILPQRQGFHTVEDIQKVLKQFKDLYDNIPF